jgi:hypothetical protein
MGMNLFFKSAGENGFVKMIIILVIALLVLSYLGFDLKSTVESQTTKSNFGYVWGYTKAFWDKYLQTPAEWLWQNIIIDIVWRAFNEGLQLLKKDQFLDMNAVGQSQATKTAAP